jgi:hypothetical protein
MASTDCIDYFLLFTNHAVRKDKLYQRYAASLLQNTYDDSFISLNIQEPGCQRLVNRETLKNLFGKLNLFYDLKCKVNLSENIKKILSILKEHENISAAAFIEDWYIYLLRLFYCGEYRQYSILAVDENFFFEGVETLQAEDKRKEQQKINKCIQSAASLVTSKPISTQTASIYNDTVTELFELIDSNFELSLVTSPQYTIYESKDYILNKFYRHLQQSFRKGEALDSVFSEIQNLINSGLENYAARVHIRLVKQFDNLAKEFNPPEIHNPLFIAISAFNIDQDTNQVNIEDVIYYCLSLRFHMLVYLLADKAKHIKGSIRVFMNKLAKMVMLATEICMKLMHKFILLGQYSVHDDELPIMYSALSRLLSVAHIKERVKFGIKNYHGNNEIMNTLLDKFEADMLQYEKKKLYLNQYYDTVLAPLESNLKSN